MGLGGRGSCSFLWQPKLAYVNPHLWSCWLLSVGLNETPLMARPNELFIAWPTGSRFSMSLEESLNSGFQAETQRSSLLCQPGCPSQMVKIRSGIAYSGYLKANSSHSLQSTQLCPSIVRESRNM